MAVVSSVVAVSPAVSGVFVSSAFGVSGCVAASVDAVSAFVASVSGFVASVSGFFDSACVSLLSLDASVTVSSA